MAFGTCISIGVASKAGPLVEHRKLRVPSILELRQRQMAAWRLVMATATKIGYVAHRAFRPIDRRVFAVHIILPPGGMRHGHHNLVTAHTLLFAHRRGRDSRVANKAGRTRLDGLIVMMQAETLRVPGGLYDA